MTALIVISGVGVAQETTPTTQSPPSDSEKTTSDDPVLELQQSDAAVIHEIDRRDGEAIVTIRSTEPVTVSYPTQTREEIEANSAREIIAETERIPRGETQIRVALTGESVFFAVDGATVQVSGDKSVETEIVSTLNPTPSLVVGAVFGVIVTGYVAYSNRQKKLEEPVRAHEVWDRL
jgi:hypothetical protein